MAPKDSEMAHSGAAAKPNPRNNATMFQIFQNVQFNVVQHKKYVKEMTKLYKKLHQDVFRESFKNALHYLFTFGDTSANVDRVVQFVATFCTTLDDEEEFLMFIFDIVFDCQCVSGQSVRYRASQLLAAVLSALGDDASLDDDLCDKLLASQMQRLQDTRGAVRCRAALALQRLQNPMEPDDEVTRAYRFHMSCDPSSSVRRAIVMSIAKCGRNVPFVLERVCDSDEAVRRAAFLYVAAVNVTQLRVRQRLTILKVGLTERSPRVRRVVEEILVPGWLSAFKGNIVELLKAIRLDNVVDAKDSQYVAGKLLESLFKRLPISELLEWLPTDKTLRLIPAEQLNKETAWYWWHLAEHLQKIDDDETLETVLPDLVILTGYIKAIIESPCPDRLSDPAAYSTRQSVLASLARLLRVYDAGDPAGRAAAVDRTNDVLTGDYGPLSPEVIRAFVSAMELFIPDVTARMEVVCRMVSTLRDPPEPEVLPPPPPVDCTEIKLQRARLRVSLNVAIEAQEEAVRDENYSLAAECKAKVADIQKKLDELVVQPTPSPPVITTIKEKLSDSDTLNKCLIILNCALDTPQLVTVTPMLQLIFNELEVEIFQNPDVLQNALETVALYGMLDKNFARENKAFFFANLIDTSNEQIVCTVLRCIVDLLCVHGAKVFEDSDESQHISKTSDKKRRTYHTLDAVDEDGSISESVMSMSPQHSTVIELLLKIMDSTCTSYRLTIVEGLCRLLHLGHLESSAILSRLLLLWFSPATDEDMLRQVIGVFFQTFPTSVDTAQDQIQKATIPTLRALANAPSSSPLAEIDQEAVVRFLVSLTKVNHEMMDSAGAMGLTLCSWLVARPEAAESGLACRMLALLPPPVHPSHPLKLQLQHAIQKIQDKQACRNLTRYLGALEALERTSLNKMSHAGTTIDGTMHAEDTLSNNIGRITTSLPQPIGRSTHVVINETVEEEVEIDETSPTEQISRISEEKTNDTKTSMPASTRNSSGSEIQAESSDVPSDARQAPDSDSSDVSPVKKAKVTKGKKKLSITKNKEPVKAGRSKEKKNKENKEVEESDKGVKRSRSQRSVADVDRAKAKALSKKSPAELPSPPADLDVSNVTVRRSTRIEPSSSSESNGSDGKKGKKGKKKEKGGNKGKEKEVPKTRRSTRSSTGSVRSCGPDLFDDSADETELHTIVYDNDIEQSLLDDSVELADMRQTSKGNVTIPETPDGSEESEPEVHLKENEIPRRNNK